MSGSGKLRIISGKWRGRRLIVPDLPGLRPTPERVRETLFNWLRNEITAAHCLDLFAGSGALGFEALSRGATEVTMVEFNLKTVEALQRQAAILGGGKLNIKLADALDWLRRTNEKPDIIFIDPPFGQGYVEKCCTLIRDSSRLSGKGMVYIETEKGLPVPEGWKVKKSLSAGKVQSMLIQTNHI